MSIQVSVIGSSTAEAGSESWTLACEVGRLLGEAGSTLICGGRGGVMEAVSKEAVNAGGAAIAILPGDEPGDANLHYTHVIATGAGRTRNLAVVASGDVVIAIGGGWGTLSEIGHARAIDREVVALRTWSVSGQGELRDAPGVIEVETPEEAVLAALGVASGAS